MKKIAKWTLSWSFSAFLVLSVIIGVTPGVLAGTSGYFEFGVNNGEASISGYTGPGGDVVVPDTLEGYPVVGIDCSMKGFSPSEYSSAFESVKSTMTSITLPSTVKWIRRGAFANCTALTSIEIPNAVETIGECAFANCTGIQNLQISSGTTKIDDFAFYGCTGLTSLTIPGSVEKISDEAFEGCSGLKELKLEDGIEKIGYDSFYGCSSLKTLVIPNSVTALSGGGKDNHAFAGCTGLTTVIIGSGLESISLKVFNGDTELRSILIPDNVTSIDNRNFEGCTNLTIYGSEASYAREYAVNHNAPFQTLEYTYTVNDGTITISSYTGDGGDITIPASFGDIPITAIGDDTFSGNTTITSATISDGITSVGNYAFENCSSLKTVKIPKSVTTIGDYAFSDCSVLTSADVPSGANVADTAFEGTPLEETDEEETVTNTDTGTADDSDNQTDFNPLPLILTILAVLILAGGAIAALYLRKKQTKKQADHIPENNGGQSIPEDKTNVDITGVWICSSCGKENEADAAFCEECGAKRSDQ